MNKTELRTLIREEIKRILKEASEYPFKFGELDMFIGKQGKYIYVFPKNLNKFDDWRSMPGSPDLPDAIERMLAKQGIVLEPASAPATVPGFAFILDKSYPHVQVTVKDLAKILNQLSKTY